MLVIGVTGSFGTGKSTVCEILAELGAVVVNADTLGHELLQRGSEAYGELITAFGKDIVAKDGNIDRKKLAEAAFKSKKTQSRLNQIMHPGLYRMVKDIIESYRKKGNPVVVVEAALLIEAGWNTLVDQVWVTVAPEPVILERLKSQRGFKKEQVLARLHTQMPSQEKVKHADKVISTDCSREELRSKITALWQIFSKI
jgi:dephospho-CoA kinase